MKIEVDSITKLDKIVKEELVTTYKVKLIGKTQTDPYNQVKVTLVLQSESPETLKQWVEMEIGALREFKLETLE